MRRLVSAGLVLVGILPTPAMAWFGQALPTLREELTQASAVLYGKLTRATPANPDGKGREGVTDCVIEKILKAHPLLVGTKTVTINHYLPSKVVGGSEVVVPGRIVEGNVEPARRRIAKAGCALDA